MVLRGPTTQLTAKVSEYLFDARFVISPKANAYPFVQLNPSWILLRLILKSLSDFLHWIMAKVAFG